MKIYHLLFVLHTAFLLPGLIISGGHGTETGVPGVEALSIETFPADDPSCNIPSFPAPGNLSSFYSPPKGDLATPSLSSTTGVNWSHAEGAPGSRALKLLASLGAVGKMDGLTTQH